MPVPVRITLIVVGFVCIVVAEFFQKASDRIAATPGVKPMETLNADARVFGLRGLGALLILVGLLSFVLANHMPH